MRGIVILVCGVHNLPKAVGSDSRLEMKGDIVLSLSQNL